MKSSDLFDLPGSLGLFAPFFPGDARPWEWVARIAEALKRAAIAPQHPTAGPGMRIEGLVWLHPSVKLPAHGTLIGPAWIGPGTELRPGIYIRGNFICGEGCVLGNSCEFKNALLLDRVQVPHFSYVGDSVLGNGSHLGAGVICSNLRLDQKPVAVRDAVAAHDTGMRKLGALVGDQAEVGCNAVLNPGAVLGRRSLVAPLTAFSGYLPPDTIARTRQPVAQSPRR